MKKLTVQQRTFAEEVAKGKTNTEAYKIAYPSSTKWNKANERISAKACILADKPEIQEYLAKLRKPVIDEIHYSMKECFKKFDEIQKSALGRRKKIIIDGVEVGEYEDSDFQSAIRCEENKAKLLGLYSPEKINTSISYKEFLDKIEQ